MMTPRNYGALKPEEALIQTPEGDEGDEEEENLRTSFPQAVSLDISITKRVSWTSLSFILLYSLN